MTEATGHPAARPNAPRVAGVHADHPPTARPRTPTSPRRCSRVKRPRLCFMLDRTTGGIDYDR